MPSQQLPLFSEKHPTAFQIPFPSTRYQGSKRKLTNWIWSSIQHLAFDSILDIFGGTAAVSHLFKTYGKQVVYNDYLKFNWNIGLALIENQQITLPSETIEAILTPKHDIIYPDFISRTFQNIYFTDDENHWLDIVVHNITTILSHPYERALARFALFQACIAKRPYNLFHRANLYMRTSEVKRSFGNKTTWDTPFDVHFRAFATEANRAVFDNGRTNQALNLDALDTPTGFDLVYIDPPYLNKKGVGVDYRDFYHFLEGIMEYSEWNNLIDYERKHRRLIPQYSIWNQATTIVDAFAALIERHRHSILVISYRDDGIPTQTQLIELLSTHSRNVQVVTQPQQYALSPQKSHELLLIAS